jgi:hypothetical protein
MITQYVIVTIIIAAALLYAGGVLIRKRRSFSIKPGCDTDCGCNASSKKLTS